MIVRINGAITEPAEPSIWNKAYEKIDEFSEWLLDKEADLIVEPAVSGAEIIADRLVEKAGEGLSALFTLINSWSPEIITLGVVACAFGFMLGPLWNGGGTKWSGRLFVTLLLGVIWRMLIP